MSFNFNLSFKAKLNITIIVAFLGFALIAFTALKALNDLDSAASRVDQLNQNIRLLKNIQVSVLQLNESVESKGFSQLQQDYDRQLSDLSSSSIPAVAGQIEEIKEALQSWAVGKQQLALTQQSIGFDINDGLRGYVTRDMAALNEGLFQMFRKLSATLASNISTFIEQQGKDNYQRIQLSIKALEDAGVEFGLTDFIAPRLNKVSHSIQPLAEAILSVKVQLANVHKSYAQLEDGVLKATNNFDEQLGLAKEYNSAVSDRTRMMVLGLSVLVAFLVTVLLLGISRSLVRSLSEMSMVLAKLAKGDLTYMTKVDSQRNDELDKVGESVNMMTVALNSVLSSVSENCQYLESGAGDLRISLEEMISGNLDTNLQADSIAVAVEQISTTMSGMSESVNCTLEQAQLAEQSAQQGGSVVSQALQSFSNLGVVFDALNIQLSVLEKESIKIDGVTDIIHSLAGQTNLLALNAAIEAARAGDAGRGFSVVATEVRNLAEETVSSTQNISKTIAAMQSCIKEIINEMKAGNIHVSNGRELASDATEAIGKIKFLVLEVAEQSNVLTSNINEANNATENIALNMSALASNVSINTEKSQSMSNYMTVVSDKTTNLLGMVNKFTLAKK
ncbi:MAG: methyl-accepting chemotaxis protein [Oceanospirillaceae bacterium]